MFDPMLDTRVVEQHKQDLLRQARLHHIRRELLGHRRAFYQRWLAMMADLMISSGNRLKQQYDESQAQVNQPRTDTVAMDMGWEHL